MDTEWFENLKRELPVEWRHSANRKAYAHIGGVRVEVASEWASGKTGFNLTMSEGDYTFLSVDGCELSLRSLRAVFLAAMHDHYDGMMVLADEVKAACDAAAAAQ